MNLNDLLNTERTYKIKYNEAVILWLRHVSREDLRQLFKQATVTRFVDHKKVEDFDASKSDCLLGRASITGWEGVMFDNTPAPCTPENIDLLMTKHSAFARFINDIAIDIDALVREEQEAERKNF